MAAQHLGAVRRGFGPHTDLSQFPPVTPGDWEFSEEVARTNVELVRGYKRLQNEFWLKRRTGTIIPMNALPRPAANSETNDSAKPGLASLAEAELLVMPEADYMNAAQMVFFRTRLWRLREELLANAAATSQNLQHNETPADPNDRATVEEEHILELRVRDRERKLLGKIEATLRRIDAGDYGYCEETGEPIGLRRLLARPTATLCVEAQERRERLQNLVAN